LTVDHQARAIHQTSLLSGTDRQANSVNAVQLFERPKEGSSPTETG